jgi:hypothetical protein
MSRLVATPIINQSTPKPSIQIEPSTELPITQLKYGSRGRVQMCDLTSSEPDILQSVIAIYILDCLTYNAMPTYSEDMACIKQAIIKTVGIEMEEDFSTKKRTLVYLHYIIYQSLTFF